MSSRWLDAVMVEAVLIISVITHYNFQFLPLIFTFS